MEDENIVEQIRINRLSKIYGFRFLASGVNGLMQSMAKMLYKQGYLSEMTDTDKLTGLFNRNFYERWVEVILAQAERVSIPVSFVMIDMNLLKKTNDTEGHAAGDRMLKKLARSLTAHARKSDVAIRLGGDEFLLILWDCDMTNASKVMEKQLISLEKRDVSFGYGISEWHKGRKLAKVIKEADGLMYEMKRASKKMRKI